MFVSNVNFENGSNRSMAIGLSEEFVDLAFESNRNESRKVHVILESMTA